MTMPSLGAAFVATFRRECLLVMRSPAEMLNPLFFFVVVVSLFPLGLSPEKGTLQLLAPGVVWVAALLAVMLSLENLFQRDQESGALDQLLVMPVPTVVPVMAKLLAHWLLTCFPLVLVSPLLAYMLHLDTAVLDEVMLTLLLGTPVLTIIGAIGAALITGLKRGGMLLAILVLPMYVPILVFGAGTIQTALDGYPVDGLLALLAAILVLSLALGPLAVVLGLRISTGD